MGRRARPARHRRPPSEPEITRRQRKRSGWVRLGVLLSATLIVIFAPACSSGGTYGACKDAVRKQLTHPESVEFTEIESYQGPSSLTGEQLNLVEGYALTSDGISSLKDRIRFTCRFDSSGDLHSAVIEP
jgi:hypothetical protein